MSVDGKAIILVGEPSLPIAATSRRYNSSLVLGIAFFDHDFHIHGIVPSVAFVVDIPETAQDNGKPYVILKDKVLQLSSPLCHAMEQSKILSTDFPNSSVVWLVSDGGPDHRLTYYSVQISLLCVSLEHNLDMLIAVRTKAGRTLQRE